MPFFDNGRNQFYPSDAIDRMYKSYQAAGGEEVKARIYLKSDPSDAITVTDHTIDQIIKGAQQVIPAQPGYRLLTFCFDPSEPDGEPWTADEPILGWRVNEYGTMEPAVLDYNFTSLNGEHAILEPNGMVHIIDGVYDNVDAWKRDMKSDALKRFDASQGGAKASS